MSVPIPTKPHWEKSHRWKPKKLFFLRALSSGCGVDELRHKLSCFGLLVPRVIKMRKVSLIFQCGPPQPAALGPRG